MRLVRTADLTASYRYLAYEAEESLLHTIMQICRRVSLNRIPFRLTVKIDEESWEKSVLAEDAACTLFVFDLYEYLFRASLEGKKAVEVNFGDGECEFLLPEIPCREKFIQFHYAECNGISEIYSKVAGEDSRLSDFFDWQDTDYQNENSAYNRLRRLARYAIFGESKRSVSDLNRASSILISDSERILTYYHPRVLLQRLKMAIYMREEIKKQDRKDTCLEELILEGFSYFSSELRYTNNQFTICDQDIYSLDQRYGTISSCLYQRMTACTSIRPFPLVNTAEKLILDIHECDKQNKVISILMVGSIDFGELRGIMDIFREELDSQIFERIELTAWSPLSQSDVNITKNQAIHYCTVDGNSVNLFDRGIMSYDIVFLIDPYFLYRLEDKAALECITDPDEYALTQKTIRNDIIHAAYESGQGYMNYTEKLSLKVKDFLRSVNLCVNSAQLSHLCILLSYSEQTELIELSRGAQEVRKEIASQNCYTTLLRYRFDECSNVIVDENEENFEFLFRLHQWYKMTAPNLSAWSLENNVEEESVPIRLDRLMYHTICRFSIERKTGKWEFSLILDEPFGGLLSDKDKIILEYVRKKIEYSFESGLHMEDSIRLARQSFANLLISRSITRKHLLYARSVIYGKPSKIEVKWSEKGGKKVDILGYNKKLREYHSRYSDYLLLCAIDKSAQNLESVSRIYQLSNALGRDDGFRAIKGLAMICEQEYCDIGDNRVRKYFLRVIEQSNYLLR